MAARECWAVAVRIAVTPGAGAGTVLGGQGTGGDAPFSRVPIRVGTAWHSLRATSLGGPPAAVSSTLGTYVPPLVKFRGSRGSVRLAQHNPHPGAQRSDAETAGPRDAEWCPRVHSRRQRGLPGTLKLAQGSPGSDIWHPQSCLPTGLLVSPALHGDGRTEHALRVARRPPQGTTAPWSGELHPGPSAVCPRLHSPTGRTLVLRKGHRLSKPGPGSSGARDVTAGSRGRMVVGTADEGGAACQREAGRGCSEVALHQGPR